MQVNLQNRNLSGLCVCVELKSNDDPCSVCHFFFKAFVKAVSQNIELIYIVRRNRLTNTIADTFCT